MLEKRRYLYITPTQTILCVSCGEPFTQDVVTRKRTSCDKCRKEATLARQRKHYLKHSGKAEVRKWTRKEK